MRVGTLDEPDLHPPNVHIFQQSKQPSVIVPEGVPRFDRFYRIANVWATDSIARMGPDWNPPDRE